MGDFCGLFRLWDSIVSMTQTGKLRHSEATCPWMQRQWAAGARDVSIQPPLRAGAGDHVFPTPPRFPAEEQLLGDTPGPGWGRDWLSCKLNHQAGGTCPAPVISGPKRLISKGSQAGPGVGRGTWRGASGIPGAAPGPGSSPGGSAVMTSRHRLWGLQTIGRTTRPWLRDASTWPGSGRGFPRGLPAQGRPPRAPQGLCSPAAPPAGWGHPSCVPAPLLI